MLLGVDEAGRGCWCGALFVAGVACEALLAQEFSKQGLKESKKLSRNKRFEWAQKIQAHKDIQSVVIAKSAQEIDSKGLSLCMQEAIKEIVLSLPKVLSVCIDGNTLFKLHFHHLKSFQAVVKGDDKIPQIAMASILAKVHKDQEMLELDRLHPEYGFGKHCGYGTRTHALALAQYGYTNAHRQSFKLKPLVDRDG
ncbi:ribonuclease HII [Helicobacter ailurogastricus]|uniref:Ribonuclease n=1 Tax=Helicobacter ailurogastricus TaxID=1578720 RepID=A0A0K2Y0S2_9HELI|nr:ribonuclease HII [Helicobacter ailurogastricus]BDQ29034.1 ribonuclease HII [Helicobacter ailurogastricus]CRF51927.1 Ribonuclease HII [Helicobacter ailurogastricus]